MRLGNSELLCIQLAQAGIPGVVSEFRFHPKRRWRCDCAIPDRKLAVEIEGGIWTNGRHTRGSGFVKDLEKYNELAVRGWRLLRVTPKQVKTGDACELVERALTAGSER